MFCLVTYRSGYAPSQNACLSCIFLVKSLVCQLQPTSLGYIAFLLGAGMRLIVCGVNHIEEANEETRDREACLHDNN